LKEQFIVVLLVFSEVSHLVFRLQIMVAYNTHDYLKLSKCLVNV